MLDLFSNGKLGHRLGVFLDVDGVLNTEADWKRPFTLNAACLRAFRAALDLAGERFDEVTVVLMSTWRKGWNPTYQPPHLRELCDPLPIEGITPDAPGVLPRGKRGKEVRYYYHRHPMDAVVVVDDDRSLYTTMDRMRLTTFFTDAATGFTDLDTARFLDAVKKAAKKNKKS